MELRELITAHFKGYFFSRDVLAPAGKLLKRMKREKETIEEAHASVVAYLNDKKLNERAPNFSPPAKCDLVACSRPIQEWPISKVNRAIQEYIYGLPASEVPEKIEDMNSRAKHDEWFRRTGVPHYGYRNVQGLNKIFNRAIQTYQGVLVKVENRNEKRKARLDRINAKRLGDGRSPLPPEPQESATDDNGRLLQPPGINPMLLGYADLARAPYVPSKFPKIHKELSKQKPEYGNYTRDPNAKIESMTPDRRAIPKGQPGYVPEWQRGLVPRKDGTTRCELSENKRMRMWWSAQNNKRSTRTADQKAAFEARARKAKAATAILVLLKIDEDWALFDIRGLLRNARWRDVVKKDPTMKEILDLFTGDPVIDPIRNKVTFLFQANVIGVVKKKPLRGKAGKKLLETLVAAKGEVPAVSVDLGQTNPVAAAAFVLRREGEDLVKTRVKTFGLTPALLREIADYRHRYDLMEERLRSQATLALTAEQQAERQSVLNCSESVKLAVCEHLKLNPERVPWALMGSRTFYLSNMFLEAGGNLEEVQFTSQKKGKKPKTLMRDDHNWSKLLRPNHSQETAKAYQEALWTLKRNNIEYGKLSKFKLELTRRCANYIVNKAAELTGHAKGEVVTVIEDLQINFFHGSGTRAAGWENYFSSKLENRWFMQAFHKTFSDTPVHKGAYLIEVPCPRTSITCPLCKHCDDKSRKGESFKCTACGAKFHADFEVATTNIMQVAITGLPMPKREQSGEEKGAGAARGPKMQKVKEHLRELGNAASLVAAE